MYTSTLWKLCEQQWGGSPGQDEDLGHNSHEEARAASTCARQFMVFSRLARACSDLFENGQSKLNAFNNGWADSCVQFWCIGNDWHVLAPICLEMDKAS